jgi:hypothetical protein
MLSTRSDKEEHCVEGKTSNEDDKDVDKEAGVS